MADSEAPLPSRAPDADGPGDGDGEGAGAAAGVEQRAGTLGRVSAALRSRTAAWAAIALACTAAGVVVSVLEARSVAHSDAVKARRAFGQSSGEVASKLKLSLQHTEDLAIGASTFFAANPKATPAEFAQWTRWLDPLRRYRELDRLALVALVPVGELAPFESRITGRTVKPPSPRSGALPEAEGFRIVPPGRRLYYCFAVAGLARSGGRYPQIGLDYCAITPSLRVSRDTGASSYSRVSAGRVHGLGIDMPVYRGDVPPAGVTARRDAFLGWVRVVVEPGVLLQAALRGQPEDAARLRHRAGSTSAVFAAGQQQAGGQSAVVRLQGGWTLRSFGPPADGSVFRGEPLTLLIGGSVLSVLIGLVVLLLGTRAPRTQPQRPPGDGEELYDRLTGLPNRVLTLDRAERMLARSRRQSGMLVGALFIDIDWLKDINDKLGQAAGDQLLKIVARRLHGVIRAQDSLGRLGGDEFVLLVESAGGGVRLEGLARRVIEALHKRVELEGFGPAFIATASIGVAFGRYTSVEDLLRDARLALDSAKAAGKDRYTVFNANMRAVIEGRGLLEADLDVALQQHQLYLLYQPVYDLDARRVVSFEALVRWRHPKQGVLPLSDFLPLAEDTGLIVPLGRWVLAEACTRAAAWSVAGRRVGVSVNVSANQLNRPGFITDLRRAIQQSGVDPATLTIEVEESTLMQDVGAAAARLAEIKQLGVGVAIDGFGSGYAYRADLERLPLDALKVDRRSLSEAEDEHYRSWLLEAILVLGHDLSLSVIAKGVESYEQLSRLQKMGFKLAQGFYLGRPVSAEAAAGVFDAVPVWQPAPAGEPGAAAPPVSAGAVAAPGAHLAPGSPVSGP